MTRLSWTSTTRSSQTQPHSVQATSLMAKTQPALKKILHLAMPAGLRKQHRQVYQEGRSLSVPPTARPVQTGHAGQSSFWFWLEVGLLVAGADEALDAILARMVLQPFLR